MDAERRNWPPLRPGLRWGRREAAEMEHSRFALSVAALLIAGIAAPPAPAQACGPLTFAFSPTGPGCDPSGLGVPPTLSATQFLPPGSSACEVRFLLTAYSLTGPTVPPPPLVLGVSNPAYPLPVLPGCTLW